MAKNRLDLHELLKSLIGNDNVYFQPPESIKIKYPCIVYSKHDEYKGFADNIPYIKKTLYKITVMDFNPDSDIPEKISNLPLCTFDRHYTTGGLNHYVYILHY